MPSTFLGLYDLVICDMKTLFIVTLNFEMSSVNKEIIELD